MKTHYADVNVMVRVHFTDCGSDDLKDQAIEAVQSEMHLGDLEECGLEIVGGVHSIRSGSTIADSDGNDGA